jgi:hypothetical protein
MQNGFSLPSNMICYITTTLGDRFWQFIAWEVCDNTDAQAIFTETQNH